MGKLLWYAPDSGRGSGVLSVASKARVAKAARIMVEHGVGSLVVLDDFREMVGIITGHDILRWSSLDTPESHFATVEEFMTSEVVTCGPDTSMREAHEIMLRAGIGHLPVVEAGRPVRVLSRRDVLAALAREDEEVRQPAG